MSTYSEEQQKSLIDGIETLKDAESVMYQIGAGRLSRADCKFLVSKISKFIQVERAERKSLRSRLMRVAANGFYLPIAK